MIWEPLRVAEVAELLAGATFPWWICGGFAIDLFLGRETRRHSDIEIGIPRPDQCALYQLLDGFEIHAARSGTLTELTPEQRATGMTEAADHCFWCRRRGADTWALELLLDERDGQDWVFRRDPRVRRPLRDVFARSADGVPYLVPEIQLLFKAKARREKDDRDFANACPALSPAQRDWLRDALRTVHPEHAWLAQLA